MGGCSATSDRSRGGHPHGGQGVALLFLFLFSNFSFEVFNIFFYTETRVNPLGVDTRRAVSFWTENLTGVLIWSFFKTEVPSVMQIETQVQKK
jgi:hypothetical protein